MKRAVCFMLSLAAMSCTSVPTEMEQTQEIEAAEVLTPAPPTPEPAAETPAYNSAIEAIGDISRGRYVEGDCESATDPDPAYVGFDVKRCTYEQGGLKAVAHVLNASAEEIARWVANACAVIGKSNDELCGSILVTKMHSSNGFIFPVAGDILEPASSAGPRCAARYGQRIVHAYFRDGITIETERGFTCEVYPISEIDADAEAFKVPAQVFNVGRIAAIHRSNYAHWTGEPLPTDDRWRTIVRDSYLEAIRTGRYTLLELVAKNTDWSEF